MYSTGGNTEMIQMSCFSNMKTCTRYVVASIVFNFAICIYVGQIQLFRQRLSKTSVKAYVTIPKGSLGNTQ